MSDLVFTKFEIEFVNQLKFRIKFFFLSNIRIILIYICQVQIEYVSRIFIFAGIGGAMASGRVLPGESKLPGLRGQQHDDHHHVDVDSDEFNAGNARPKDNHSRDDFIVLHLKPTTAEPHVVNFPVATKHAAHVLTDNDTRATTTADVRGEKSNVNTQYRQVRDSSDRWLSGYADGNFGKAIPDIPIHEHLPRESSRKRNWKFKFQIKVLK